MDENQKKLLSDKEGDIASGVCAKEFAELLRDANLITKEQKIDIMKGDLLNFNRNLKLIQAVQESRSPGAFDKLCEALENIGLNTTKLFGPRYSVKTKGYFHRFEKFLPTFSKNSSHSLGINSYKFNSSAGQASHSRSTNAPMTNPDSHDKNTSLPQSDRSHLLTSSPRDNGDSSSSSQEAGVDSGYVLARRHPNGQLPGGPVTLHSSGSRRNSTVDDKISQIPDRARRESNLLNNLSLKEESREQSSDSDEPIVQWHAYPTHGDNPVSGATSPHRCNPSYSSASSESGESTSDSMIIDRNLILDSNVMSAIAREGPHLMTVKTALVCHNHPDEDYKMTSRPRGMCLIVNNIDFDYEVFPTRKGSDEDANRFDQIFKQLGFETIMRRNLAAEDMKKVFEDLSRSCKPEHDALFVFILSHGSDKGIYGTDGLELHLEEDIISWFDNRNCKAMIGKPKVFVIQACRGRAKDFGIGFEGDTTDSVAWPAGATVESMSQENRVPTSWLPSARPLNGKKRKHPIRTDMLLVFSCLAGFVSVRNETAGSWLGVALAYFIMTHAHDRDLVRILNHVTSDIIQRESAHGHIQSIELKLLGWTKNLYFNPGHYL